MALAFGCPAQRTEVPAGNPGYNIREMTLLTAFADVSIYQLLLVAGVALFASVLGGVAGYGTGALMPLVLVPMVGAEQVVPIIALADAHQLRARRSHSCVSSTGGAPDWC